LQPGGKSSIVKLRLPVLSSKTAKLLPTENFEPPSAEVQPGIQSTIPHSIVTSSNPPSTFSELLLAANLQPLSQFVESLPAENFEPGIQSTIPTIAVFCCH